MIDTIETSRHTMSHEEFQCIEDGGYGRDSSEDRIARLMIARQSIYDKPLFGVLLDINRVVAKPTTPYEKYLSRTGMSVFREVQASGMHDMVGLSYYGDLVSDIFPYAVQLAHEVGESGLSDDEKLQRLANINGVMVAESQAFTLGNKRTARAFYGRIRFGFEGMARAQNALIDFRPPEMLERVILLQNMAKLATRAYDIYDDRSGGVWVDDSVEQSLAEARAALDTVRMHWGKSPTKYLGDIAFNRVKLDEQVRQKIKDDGLRSRLMGVFFQEHYGPAAYSLVRYGGAGDDPERIIRSLTPERAQAMCVVSESLLKMRIKTLMAGIACGGRFITVETSNEYTKSREITELSWQPVYIE